MDLHNIKEKTNLIILENAISTAKRYTWFNRSKKIINFVKKFKLGILLIS